MGGNNLVMFSSALRGDTNMRAFLPGNFIPHHPQPYDQLQAINVPGATSYRHQLVPDKVQPDQRWFLSGFVEITIHGLPDLLLQLLLRFALRVNAESQSPSGKTAGRVFQHFENHFLHEFSLAKSPEMSTERRSGVRQGAYTREKSSEKEAIDHGFHG